MHIADYLKPYIQILHHLILIIYIYIYIMFIAYYLPINVRINNNIINIYKYKK